MSGLKIYEIKYFAPLSSFKPKHKKMDEGVDFIKIKDYSVININNMIPVPDGYYHLVDVNGEKDPHAIDVIVHDRLKRYDTIYIGYMTIADGRYTAVFLIK